jgi:hypothetical protein
MDPSSVPSVDGQLDERRSGWRSRAGLGAQARARFEFSAIEKNLLVQGR